MRMKKQKAVGNKNSSDANPSASSPALLCEEDVQCPICLNLLVEPVRMPCRHCLCRICFTTNLKKSTLQCPVCRARIGTFARRSMKADSLVDEVLWKAIQRQFKQKLKLQKVETADRDALVPSNRVLSPVVGLPAAPGEIRKEFEQQMQQHKQAHQENLIAVDRQLAACLQAQLNTPAGVTRRQSMAASVTAESVSTSSDSESDGDEDPSESRKQSARRLFMNLSNKSSSAKSNPSGSLSSAHRKRKAVPNRSVTAKKNSAPHQRSRSGSKKRQQFAGCVKRPRLAGTAALNITLDTTDDDETEVSFKSNDASLNTSNDKLLTPKTPTFKDAIASKTSVIMKANKARKNSRQTNLKSGSTAARSNIKQCSPTQTSVVKCATPLRTCSPPVAKAAKRAFVSSKANISGEPLLTITSDSSAMTSVAGSSRGSLSSGSSSRTSSGYGSGSYSVSPYQRRRGKLGLDELQDVAIALMQERPHDLASTAALVAEQKALEAALKQEAEDMKLAQRLQRQFSKLKVDRTQGSGEEYGLRSRDLPARGPRGRTSATREVSPCY